MTPKFKSTVFQLPVQMFKHYSTPPMNEDYKLTHPGTAEWEDCGWRDGWDLQADPSRTASVNWLQQRHLHPDVDPPLLHHQTSAAGYPQSGRCRLLWTDPPDEDLADRGTMRQTWSSVSQSVVKTNNISRFQHVVIPLLAQLRN